MNKKSIVLLVIFLVSLAVVIFWYFSQKSAEVVFCKADQRNVQACIQLYDPVCAKVNIQCITTPCDPINETFSNSCFACSNQLVESYAKGACENSNY